MENKTILIFGGTGSLGHKLNERYCDKNKIYNFSRDECKHWKMRLHFNNHKNINFIIGNVADINIVEQSIKRVLPNIIIIASAMKHIDQCEINTSESIKNNLLGTKNILDSIEKLLPLSNLETVLLVSSDKACSPINNYGMCKALAETLIVERAHYIPSIKFVAVRYGNVLNSSGSIIPLLHKIGNDYSKTHFTLTSKDMTRFIMTLDDSVNLITYAILNGESGDIVIPQLHSMYIEDLFSIFSDKYNKPIKITGLRSGEKIHESLINETQSRRTETKNGYMHIKSTIKYPNILFTIDAEMICEYDSSLYILNKEELKEKLLNLNIL